MYCILGLVQAGWHLVSQALGSEPRGVQPCSATPPTEGAACRIPHFMTSQLPAARLSGTGHNTASFIHYTRKARAPGARYIPALPPATLLPCGLISLESEELLSFRLPKNWRPPENWRVGELLSNRRTPLPTCLMSRPEHRRSPGDGQLGRAERDVTGARSAACIGFFAGCGGQHR